MCGEWLLFVFRVFIANNESQKPNNVVLRAWKTNSEDWSADSKTIKSYPCFSRNLSSLNVCVIFLFILNTWDPLVTNILSLQGSGRTAHWHSEWQRSWSSCHQLSSQSGEDGHDDNWLWWRWWWRWWWWWWWWQQSNNNNNSQIQLHIVNVMMWKMYNVQCPLNKKCFKCQLLHPILAPVLRLAKAAQPQIHKSWYLWILLPCLIF